MPYDPSDLRLPPWLLRTMDRLVGGNLRLGPWRLGLTRPGALYLATLLGVAAAALYSGNNLLYLCGAMFACLGGAGLISGMRLLRRLPPLTPLLPDHTLAGIGHVLRESIATDSPFAAMVGIAWQGDDDTPPLRFEMRLDRGTAHLNGLLLAERRGIRRLTKLLLESSAPLGLWRLGLMREESYEWIVAPAPVAIQQGLAGKRQAAEPQGDEWRDLRAYTPGDLRSRIHWRKLPIEATDPRQWLVKHFASPPPEERASLLRVDLRLPEGASSVALDRLLGQVTSWLLQERGGRNGVQRLIVGANECDPATIDAWRLLAGAMVEARPPAGEGGMLLSLVSTA